MLQRLLKSQAVTKGFGPSSNRQLGRAAISKSTIFSSTASAAATVDYTVDYIMQHHCGYIYLAASVCTHVSLFSLDY